MHRTRRGLHRIGFCQARSCHTANVGRVIRAVDGHCHDFGRAIHRRNREAVGVGLARHKLVMSVVHHIGPHTSRGQAELAITVVTRHTRLRHKRSCVVHITDGQRACCRLCHVALCQRRRAHAANHCCVIRSVNGDGNYFTCAISCFDCEAIGVLLASCKLVMCSVCYICPCAGSVNAEFAVAIVARNIVLYLECAWAVYVRCRKLTACTDRRSRVTFCHSLCQVTSNHGSFVNVVNG